MNITSIKYINMDKDDEKNFLINQVLRKYDLHAQRIPGIEYAKNPDLYQKYLKKGLASYVNSDSDQRKAGVMGCWIAHIKALESIKEDRGFTVVLEDDFVCKPSFFDDALKMIQSLDDNFDVIIFDPRGDGPNPEHEIKKGIYNTRGESFPLYTGTQCVFYNNKNVPKIIATLLDSEIRDFDGHLLHDHNINTLVFYTGLSKSVYFYSDIEGVVHRHSFWHGIQDWINYMMK